MSLVMIGDVVDVTSRDVRPDASKGQTWAPFSVTTVHLLAGRSVHRISLGKEFRGDVPKPGDECALQVSVRAYPSNGGSSAAFEFTAWENVSADIKVSAKSV